MARIAEIYGKGIKENNLEKVIDKFYQQIRKFKPQNKLYVARELLDAIEQDNLK